MQTTVSVRWQTVIPRQIREVLGIKPKTKLEWQVKDGVIIVYPIPPDPVRATRGMLKGRGPTTQTLLVERRLQREKEQAQEEA
ncbi:MAG: AbrB/MazE/SpoVT family DNA-binding domain-containing protein [Anaerolineae bacterium]